MDLNSYSGIQDWILKRAYEDPDTTGDWDDAAGLALVQAWRDLFMRHPWLGFIKDPPGVFLTEDDVSATLTASAGTAVTGTLSSAPSVSYEDWKMRPSGAQWVARVTAHTSGSTSITFDAIPEALSSKTVALFKDEYELASDLGCFVDGLWSGTQFVELWDEGRLKAEYPDPPVAGDYPVAFCRLTRRKIRFSHYPSSVRRYAYPYSYEPADPSGSGTVELESHLRAAWAEWAYALLLDMKVDRRARDAMLRAEALIERAVAYETRRRLGFGQRFTTARPARYGS